MLSIKQKKVIVLFLKMNNLRVPQPGSGHRQRLGLKKPGKTSQFVGASATLCLNSSYLL